MSARVRTECRELIEQTIASALEENPSLKAEPAALFQLVSQAYPFPQRKPRIVKLWTSELRSARVRFEERLRFLEAATR